LELTDGTFRGEGNRDIDFGGKSIAIRSQTGSPELCIIDCEASVENPHRGFVFRSGEGIESVLEGITITGGIGPAEDNVGGAVLCDNQSSPSLTDCAFLGNTGGLPSGGAGGGMYCGHSSSPILMHCTFRSNLAQDGGAVECADGASPQFTACVFDSNTSSGNYGGALDCRGGTPSFVGCTFSHNSAMNGVAIRLATPDAVLVDCEFFGNQGSGGAIDIAGGSPSITACTFTGNTGSTGGALKVWLGASPTISECDFINNVGGPGGFGGAAYCRHASTPTFASCRFLGNIGERHGGAIYAFDDSALEILGCTFEGNSTEGQRWRRPSVFRNTTTGWMHLL
jgi:predicted outer membrane repeat protein